MECINRASSCWYANIYFMGHLLSHTLLHTKPSLLYPPPLSGPWFADLTLHLTRVVENLNTCESKRPFWKFSLENQWQKECLKRIKCTVSHYYINVITLLNYWLIKNYVKYKFFNSFLIILKGSQKQMSWLNKYTYLYLRINFGF